MYSNYTNLYYLIIILGNIRHSRIQPLHLLHIIIFLLVDYREGLVILACLRMLML